VSLTCARRAVEARQQDQRLGELIIARGWVDEEGLGRLIAGQWRLPFLNRETLTLDPAAAELLQVEQARALSGCVIRFHDDGPLVAVADPTTERLNRLRDQLRANCGAQASFAVVSGSSLEGLLAQLAHIRSSASASTPEYQAAPDVAPAPHDPVASPPTDSDQHSAPHDAGAAAEAMMAEALLADLAQASADLAILHERVERLGAASRASEQQAADLRRERDTAGQETARHRERVRELEQTLDHERQHQRALRQRLIDLLAEFER
jgi:hypothetical protein